MRRDYVAQTVASFSAIVTEQEQRIEKERVQPNIWEQGATSNPIKTGDSNIWSQNKWWLHNFRPKYASPLILINHFVESTYRFDKRK